MERQFLHCFSKNFGKLECSMSFLRSTSVTPPSSWGLLILSVLPTYASCRIVLPTPDCLPGRGSEAPWDDSCSQTQIQCHLITVSWCCSFRAEDPSCNSAQKPWLCTNDFMSQRRCSLSRLGLSPATAAGAAIPDCWPNSRLGVWTWLGNTMIS